MKKLVSIGMILLMILSLTTISVFAEETTFTESGLTYTITDSENHTVSVTGSDKNITEYKIPKTIKFKGIEYAVTSIGVSAFRKSKALTKVEIPNSVTNIGESAFSLCENLVSVEIPDSVSTIGNSAFNECSSLTNVKLPEGIVKLQQDMFYSCTKLPAVTIPNSVREIHSNAFLACPFSTLVIPGNVEKIAGSIIAYTKIESMSLPNNIKSLEVAENAFSNVKTLKEVLVVTSNSQEPVNPLITKAIAKSGSDPVTYYRGVTNVKANQNSLDAIQGETVNLSSYFSVSSAVYDENGDPANGTAVPDQYLNPNYRIQGNTDSNTYIDGTTLHIGSQENEKFVAEGILNGQTVSLAIHVEQSADVPAISKVEMLKQPNKVSYVEGESFNPSGLELKVYYSDGTDETVAYNESTKNHFTFTVKDPLTLSDTKVVISYGNYTIEQSLNIQRRPILVTPDGNQIIGLKSQYTRGEPLKVSVAGAGMDRVSPVKGDIRYRPVSWNVFSDQQFADETYQISLNTKSMEKGKYQLVVRYQKEEFDGGKWAAQEMVLQTEAFEIVAEGTPPASDPTDNIKETPTSPKTGDATVAAGLFLLTLVSGGMVFLSSKKRTSDA